MTQAVAHLLTEIERLSLAERVEFRRAVVERIPMSDDLTDDDFAALASDNVPLARRRGGRAAWFLSVARSGR